MIRRPPRSTQSRSSAASDVYKRQAQAVVAALAAAELQPHVGEGDVEVIVDHDELLDGNLVERHQPGDRPPGLVHIAERGGDDSPGPGRPAGQGPDADLGRDRSRLVRTQAGTGTGG